MKTIECENCFKEHNVESLKKSCGNCFACTGCEIYLCPNCHKEIIVTPIQTRFSPTTDELNGPNSPD